MKELMIALMVWASAYTGLPVPDDVPIITHVDRCQMYWMMRPGEDCPEPGSGASEYVALYANGVIYLRSEWKLADLHDVSVLLHEVVHYMQEASGLPMSEADGQHCPGRNLEKPAYDAQMAWLQAAGVKDVLGFLHLNAMMLMHVTSCPRH